MRMMRTLLSALTGLMLLSLMLLAACAPAPQQIATAPSAPAPSGPTIGGLIIDNYTNETLSDVRIGVRNSSEFVHCGYIPPQSYCSTTFPERRYQGNAVTVLWVRGGVPQATRPFIIPLPRLLPDGPLEVVIRIGGVNGFSAFMRPQWPQIR